MIGYYLLRWNVLKIDKNFDAHKKVLTSTSHIMAIVIQIIIFENGYQKKKNAWQEYVVICFIMVKL